MHAYNRQLELFSATAAACSSHKASRKQRAPTISTMLRKKRAASASENVPLDTMRSNSSPPTHSSITMCTAQRVTRDHKSC